MLQDTHFLGLDPLTRPVNNSITIFLINPNIISYHVFFIKYLWISKISLVSTELKSTEKKFTIPFNPIFFTILNVKSSEVLPKHSAESFISEFFCF